MVPKAGVEVLSGCQESPDGVGEPRPLLEISHATKVYGGGFLQTGDQTVALRDLSLSIAQSPATITTVAGESGSGKTTLAHALLGFVGLTSARSCTAAWMSPKLDRRAAGHYRREVQAIFQDPYEVYNPFYKVEHVFDLVIRRFQLASTARRRAS